MKSSALGSLKQFVVARSLLSLLLLADTIFIGTHILLWSVEWRSALLMLNIERDGSLPEYFSYHKWLVCALGCIWLFTRGREALYLSWGALFFYLLLDDSNRFHERGGAFLVDLMKWGPALHLRGQDFSELTVMATAGVILLSVIAITYRMSINPEAKAFSRHLLLCLAAFVFFAAGVDMLHIMLRPWTTLRFFTGVVEDVGEMVVASVFTSIVWQQVRSLQNPPEHLPLPGIPYSARH